MRYQATRFRPLLEPQQAAPAEERVQLRLLLLPLSTDVCMVCYEVWRGHWAHSVPLSCSLLFSPSFFVSIVSLGGELCDEKLATKSATDLSETMRLAGLNSGWMNSLSSLSAPRPASRPAPESAPSPNDRLPDT